MKRRKYVTVKKGDISVFSNMRILAHEHDINYNTLSRKTFPCYFEGMKIYRVFENTKNESNES